MKLICFISLQLILLVNYSFAQNWQTINKDVVTYFTCADSLIRAIRIDNVAIHGDTTEYRAYHMIRHNDEYACYNALGDHWVGKKVQILPDGANIFYNQHNMPMLIKTNALVGNAWVFCTFSNNYYVEATVSSSDTINFYGITDSIKYISLQLRNAEGNPVGYVSQGDSIFYINNCIISITKNLGFYNIPDFYKFPVNPNNYSDEEYYMYYPGNYYLAGISNPPLGYQNITFSQLFDFNTNDEIHTLEVCHVSPWATSAYSIQQIDKYLSKHVSENNDTMIYTIERCSYTSTYESGVIDSVYFHDTVQVKYILSWYNSHLLNALPFEPYIDFDIGYNYSFMSGKYWSMDYSFFLNGEDTTCVDRVYYDPSFNCYFYKGLGGAYYHYYNLTYQETELSIVYYKKGAIEWGTPYDCSILLKSNEIMYVDEPYKVYPNPASQFINISKVSGATFDSYYQLVDMRGVCLFSGQFGDNIMLDVSDLEKGLYIIKIIGCGKQKIFRVVIE